MRNVIASKLLFTLLVSHSFAEADTQASLSEEKKPQLPVPLALQYYDDEAKNLEQEQNRAPSSPEAAKADQEIKPESISE